MGVCFFRISNHAVFLGRPVLDTILPGPTMSLPEQIKENCQEDSYYMVNKYNTQDNAACVQSPKLLSLITSLSALMLQVKRVADGER